MAKVQLDPYLFFSGNAKEAMEFYKGVFGGQLEMQSMDEVPEDAMPPGTKESMKGMIMHASLDTGDFKIFASDSPKASPKAAKIELSLGGEDETKLRGWFEALSEGGKVKMPLKKQFWGDIYGQLIDKYNIEWMVNIASAKE